MGIQAGIPRSVVELQGHRSMRVCESKRIAEPAVVAGRHHKIPSFGRLHNVPGGADTFAGAVFAPLHTGQTAKHACQHFLQAFASLGEEPEGFRDDPCCSRTWRSWDGNCWAAHEGLVKGRGRKCCSLGIVLFPACLKAGLCLYR